MLHAVSIVKMPQVVDFGHLLSKPLQVTQLMDVPSRQGQRYVVAALRNCTGELMFHLQ